MNDLTKEQIKINTETYDQYAHEYAVKVERKPEVVNAVEELILLPFYRMLSLKKDLHIAFLGCGTGRDMNWFINKGYKCDGYDSSKGMIREAKSWVNKGSFIHLDISKQSLPRLKYSGVYCESALAYIPYKDLDSTLKNISNSLTDKGVALLGFKIDGTKVYEDKTLTGIRYYRSVKTEEVLILVKKYFKIKRKLVSKDSFDRPTEWLDLFLEKL